MTVILRVDASARADGSYSRQLGDRLLQRLLDRHPKAKVICRDLAQGVPLLTTAELAAREAAEPTPQQSALLQPSNTLIAELQQADLLLLTTPIYNFSVPGALKAYIDQVCRPQLTFRYTELGPKGLLSCRAFLVITSAGTAIGSGVDFATGYLQHVLRFMGVEEIAVIGCDRLWQNPEARFAAAQRQIDQLVL